MFLKARYLTQRTHKGLLQCIRAMNFDIATYRYVARRVPWKEKKIAVHVRLGWQIAG